MALAIVAVSLAWLLAEQASAPEAFLMCGELFSAAELRDMEGAFGQAGLEDYHVDGARIRVPQGQQSKYMAALAEAGALPSDFGEYLRKAVDGNGLMLYGPRQEAQLKVAVESELQGVINHFQGVESSFVHIAEETSRGFPQVKTVTASVSVQASRGQAVDERTASAIRWIVASAWGGLKPEGVTVLDLSTKRLFAGPLQDATQPAAAGGQYAETKRQLERDWQDKITRLLGIPGAIVTTNVELEPDGRSTRRVSVSVAVPQVYFEEVWRGRQGRAERFVHSGPDPSALVAFERSESERIKQAIVPLLVPAGDAASSASQVAVTTMYPTADPALAEPDPQERALQWLAENWRTVGTGIARARGAAGVALRDQVGAGPPRGCRTRAACRAIFERGDRRCASATWADNDAISCGRRELGRLAAR